MNWELSNKRTIDSHRQKTAMIIYMLIDIIRVQNKYLYRKANIPKLETLSMKALYLVLSSSICLLHCSTDEGNKIFAYFSSLLNDAVRKKQKQSAFALV